MRSALLGVAFLAAACAAPAESAAPPPPPLETGCTVAPASEANWMPSYTLTVRNNTSTPMDEGYVTVILYNASGSELGSDQDFVHQTVDAGQQISSTQNLPRNLMTYEGAPDFTPKWPQDKFVTDVTSCKALARS